MSKLNSMKTIFLALAVGAMAGFSACNAQTKPAVPADSNKAQTPLMEQKNEYNKLTPQQERVILHKATDMPFTGEYYQKKDQGVYICRQCNARLYRSDDKFDSHCGWPSFDDEIEGSVIRVPDADGMRTEIICANCGGHLGHVFEGEEFTDKDTRHCVNTSSILFVPSAEVDKIPPMIKK